ncbi:MAG: ABC transporter transmembrane domain-containing protein, partial [Intestinibacter sp.]|uniref:ABC transporter transmembrane domain-containing protein n=1 Tax=Intestinibacter sp. TaxID=1965304 RepID=UPI003F17B7AE
MSKGFDKNDKRPNAPKGNPMKTLKRIMDYIFKEYKFLFFIVLITIFISSIVSVIGNVFLKSLIDDYIVPLIGSTSPNFVPLLKALCIMAAIFYTGAISSYIYSRLMVNISQGTLKNIRDDLFEHMEKLPIKYFDTHAHGDIMSIYTNDTDTLRQ